jgi:hypothetical protein
MHARLLAAATLLALSTGAHAELHKFAQPGTVTIDAGAARDATLQVICSPDRDGGAISIELVVPEANTRKDFDYDDFEGPDAVGGDKVPAQIAWTPAAGAATTITHSAGGWYAPEPPDSFMFGISQLSHRREAPARLLTAIGSDAGKLTWTQAGFDKARKLVATFDFDAATAARLHATVSSCLPILAGKKGGG